MEEEAGAEVPLLKIKGDYHQGCPGCAYDRKKEVYRGLPYKEFLYLWMICLTAGMYGTFPPFFATCDIQGVFGSLPKDFLTSLGFWYK
jgi:hypothetical protein